MITEWDVVSRTFAALIAGGAIGLERSYHGRAAGLRTYALVCFGSALLVAGALFAYAGGADAATRVIQGIVTGIGFLGAGVIVKEGFTVRGLTTAASIWVVSAVGVVLGSGSYVSGIEASVVTLTALALLRRLEDRLPTQAYVHFEIGFERAHAMDEAQLRHLLERHGFSLRDLSYRLHQESQLLEYRMVLWSDRPGDAGALERSLLAQPEVLHFRISPSRD
jgi:putative Mg2+ transporter-C (MgtC) family protein